MPGTVDPAEMAVRVVLGQQVSVTAAGTLASRLAVAAGEPVEDPEGGLTRLFPTPAAIAAVDPAVLAMPASRRTSVLTLAGALADGTVGLDLGTDPAQALDELTGLPGIGPWTRAVIAMRALGDPDAFAPTDLGVRLAARAAGLPATPAALVKRAERWRPWRALRGAVPVGDRRPRHQPAPGVSVRRSSRPPRPLPAARGGAAWGCGRRRP